MFLEMQDFNFFQIFITFAQISPKFAQILSILPKNMLLGNAAAFPAPTALMF